MRHVWLLMTVAAVFGACTSGANGCDKGPKKNSDPSSFSGGGANPGRGGGETVSFQKMGLQRLAASRVATSTATVAAASTATVAGSAEAGAAAEGTNSPNAAAAYQNVLCGGFTGLPSDCIGSPQFPALVAKCCPNGVVLACRAIPGGARLTGRGCTSSAP